MKGENHTHKWSRLLMLVISSTVIAEVLSGSTTVSRIGMLPIQFLPYGSAAIIVREVSVRLNAGWATTLLLGLAFGLTLEGLVLQSVFNPVFLTNNLTFGRAFGVNWVWLAYMPPYHAFWSVAVPVLLCEVIFGDKAPQPWAGKVLLWLCGAVFILLCIAFHFVFIKISKFNATGIQFAVLSGVIILVILLAINLRGVKFQSIINNQTGKAHFWLVSLVSLIAGVLWYAGFATIFIATKPAPWVSLLAAPIIAATFFIIITKWKLALPLGRMGKLAMVCGLLTGQFLFGYFATASNRVDHYGQFGLMFIVLLLLFLLYKKVNKVTTTATN
jgi:hypothetical protein